MQTKEQLRNAITQLDGKDYGAYQSLKGHYDFGSFQLIIEQIPKDPFAPPPTGIYRVLFPLCDTQVTPNLLDSKNSRIACRDYYARQFFRHSQAISGQRRGTGFSGIITVDEPGQAILERSSVLVDNKQLELRCFIGLPANKRIIRSALAITMLCDELPDIVRLALHREFNPRESLLAHIHCAEDAQFLRSRLAELGLLAFIADGAILPRHSSRSDRPLDDASVVAFQSPASLRLEVELPHGGEISGMGIPQGITLLAGGGFHGKSTLLQTIEMGVYDHIAGDGRERCVSIAGAVKIRAYSGRQVTGCDISPFIQNLPLHRDSHAFSSNNASGSTSQAASIVEALELGAHALLMDEDSCATNFMIRDSYMQQLVKKEDEPITSYIDKIAQLYHQNGVSTILALGGVGDYFAVADRVIQMIRYQPRDVSREARAIIRQRPSTRVMEDSDRPIRPRARIPLAQGIDPMSEYGRLRVQATQIHSLKFGIHSIDLTDLEQLIELSQTRAIGHAILHARRYMDENTTVQQIIQRVMNDIESQGLDILNERISGHFAGFRPFELAQALNRLPSLQLKS